MRSDIKIFGAVVAVFATLAVLAFLPGGKNEAVFTKAVRKAPAGQNLFAKAQLQSADLSQNVPAVPEFPAGHGGVPVLMYHHVGALPPNPDPTRRDLTVSTADFSAQIALLDQLGYHSVSTADLNAYLSGMGGLPPKPIVISFDDGYLDVFQNAVPVLEQHHMTGVFAIITGFAGQTQGSNQYAGWDILRAAQNAGMEMVCHSVGHIDFADPKYSSATRFAQIADCKQALLQHLGVSVSSFVYPYGQTNADTEQILKTNGFELAFTTAYGFVRKGENLLELPRVRVHGNGEPIEIFEQNLGLLPKGVLPPRWRKIMGSMGPAGI